MLWERQSAGRRLKRLETRVGNRSLEELIVYLVNRGEARGAREGLEGVGEG